MLLVTPWTGFEGWRARATGRLLKDRSISLSHNLVSFNETALKQTTHRVASEVLTCFGRRACSPRCCPRARDGMPGAPMPYAGSRVRYA